MLGKQPKDELQKANIHHERPYEIQWTQLMTKYPPMFAKSIIQPKDMSNPTIKPKTPNKETKPQCQERVNSEMSQLHQEHKTKNSQTLHTYFKQNPEKRSEYHKISKCKEASFQTEEIPRNKMIQYLERLPGKKPKIIADMASELVTVFKM